jgi:hypothetical protein
MSSSLTTSAPIATRAARKNAAGAVFHAGREFFIGHVRPLEFGLQVPVNPLGPFPFRLGECRMLVIRHFPPRLLIRYSRFY